jgi:hemolysin activation/secretion protein
VTRAGLGAALALAMLAATGPAAAQSSSGTGLRPGENRPALPEFLPSQPTEPLGPPPAPPPSPGPQGVGPTVVVSAFRFVGNTVIPTAELEALAAPYVSRPITAEDLEQLRVAITQLYIGRGYINSGAVLPDQQVGNGTVTYRIVEGRLSRIDIAGQGGLDPDYIRDRLKLGAGPPLNVNELGDRFRILLQDPLIAQLNGRLGPGVEPGDAALDVAVERATPYTSTLFIDNHRPPSVGAFEQGGSGTVRNLTGWGDWLTLDYSRTEGLDDVSLAGAVPVTPWDTLLHARGEYVHSRLIQQPFDQLDIEGDSWTAELGVRQPVYRTPETELALDLTMARRHSGSSLLGEPFDFTPATKNGNQDFWVLRFAQELTDRSPDQVIAFRSTMSFGFDMLGSTNTGFEPDSQFFAWLGQLQAARRLPFRDIELVLRADAQLANSPLPPIEQFAIGGAYSVRGYLENQFVSDNGLDASIEARIPVLDFTVPLLGEPLESHLRLAPFFDWGTSWSDQGGFGNRQEIYSVGIGLLWTVTRWLDASLYYGYALKPVTQKDQGNDLQAHGISFRVAFTPF